MKKTTKKVIALIIVIMLVSAFCTCVACADGADPAPAETYKSQIISMLGDIVATIVVGIAGYVGICLKRLFERYVNTDDKKNVANTCVNFVEQVYKDLHGEEKLNIAIKYATIILTEKGIQINETELRTLVEAAVKEMNDKFAHA